MAITFDWLGRHRPCKKSRSERLLSHLTNIHWNGFRCKTSVACPVETTEPWDKVAKDGVLFQLDHLVVGGVVEQQQVVLLHEGGQGQLDQWLKLLEVRGQLS